MICQRNLMEAATDPSARSECVRGRQLLAQCLEKILLDREESLNEDEESIRRQLIDWCGGDDTGARLLRLVPAVKRALQEQRSEWTLETPVGWYGPYDFVVPLVLGALKGVTASDGVRDEILVLAFAEVMGRNWGWVLDDAREIGAYFLRELWPSLRKELCGCDRDRSSPAPRRKKSEAALRRVAALFFQYHRRVEKEALAAARKWVDAGLEWPALPDLVREVVAIPESLPRHPFVPSNPLARSLPREVIDVLGEELPASEMVGSHPSIVAIRLGIRRLARSMSNLPEGDDQRKPCVLVLGETGTGKELVALGTHETLRPKGPFVPVNCGALTDTLVESELFGNVKGAFTDATENKPGLLSQAKGGTLFLDEVGDLSAKAQQVLLRVLDTGEYRCVGGKETRRFDAMVVSATNREQFGSVSRDGRGASEVNAEARPRLREDLLHRLASVVFRVPPLRDRGDDLLKIAAEILRRVGGEQAEFDAAAEAVFSESLSVQDWPGNVRQLRNDVLAAWRSARADGGNAVRLGDLTARFWATGSAEPSERSGEAGPPPVSESLVSRLTTAVQRGGPHGKPTQGDLSKALEGLVLRELKQRLGGMQKEVGMVLGKAKGTVSRRFKKTQPYVKRWGRLFS